MSPRLLLIAPPFSQLNTPYPAITYLTGFASSLGVEVSQADLSIETARALFSSAGVRQIFDEVAALGERQGLPPQAWEMLRQRRRYEDAADAVLSFLAGGDGTLAHRIAHRYLLPWGPRFQQLPDLEEAFGALGTTDQARHLASLFLDDLADLVGATLAPHFTLTRYGERLAASAERFDPLAEALAAPPNLVDRLYLAALDAQVAAFAPTAVGFSVPFPGNLYAALRGGAHLKDRWPGVAVILGGGYPNTELRGLTEPRIFDCVDFITLDDGERPLQCLLEHLGGRRPRAALRRTFAREGGQVVYLDGDEGHDIPQRQLPAPTWRGLDPQRYLSVVEVLNPMHRLWGDGRWLKLTLAHGCYWKRCAFCDLDLDYIGRFQPDTAERVVDRMEALIAETGVRGFHFVDEAAPPALLKEVSLAILRRGLTVSWWGNIRFERRFDADLCLLMAQAGCIAVSGGLEVASDRLLALMEKGVTVAQVARACRDFTAAGIMVHAYLMYGFPTQTVQETVDSLERVRQLFEAGILQSAFWHRFVATAHSPVGQRPERYGVRVTPPTPGAFAVNDLELEDPTGVDHDALGPGLDLALANYMGGQGLDVPVGRFFEVPTPEATVPADLIALAIGAPLLPDDDAGRRGVWVGEPPEIELLAGRRRAPRARLHLSGPCGEGAVDLPIPLAEWLRRRLELASPRGAPTWPPPTVAAWLEDGEDGAPSDAEALLSSPAWRRIRELGLALV